MFSGGRWGGANSRSLDPRNWTFFQPVTYEPEAPRVLESHLTSVANGQECGVISAQPSSMVHRRTRLYISTERLRALTSNRTPKSVIVFLHSTGVLAIFTIHGQATVCSIGLLAAYIFTTWCTGVPYVTKRLSGGRPPPSPPYSAATDVTGWFWSWPVAGRVTGLHLGLYESDVHKEGSESRMVPTSCER